MVERDNTGREADRRALRARIAAAERWSRVADRTIETAPARRGLLAKFEQEVDPDGVLTPDERTRRTEQLRRAHMLRMSLRSAEKRRRRAG